LLVVAGSEAGAEDGVAGTEARMALYKELLTLPIELVATSWNLKAKPVYEAVKLTV
jgi:hypothetical protein